MMSFAAVYVSLALLFHRSSVEAKCEKPGLHFLGDEVKIICGIQGTYSWPGWNKWKNGVTRITNDGSPLINPDYAARCSYDTDNKTLIITNVMKSDEGQYVCAKAEKEDSPQTFELIVKEPNYARGGINNAIVAFFVLAIVVLAVVIIRQCCMIRIYKEVKRTKMKIMVSSIVILIIAAVLFIIVLAWFIVIQETKEDCEKLTKKDNYLSLLAVEIIVFMLGAIILVYQFIERKKIKNEKKGRQPNIEPSFPNDVTEENSDRLLSEEATIEQQFMETEKEGKPIFTLNRIDTISCIKKGKSTSPDSPTLGHKTSGDEQITEEPQLPEDRSEEGKSTTPDSPTLGHKTSGDEQISEEPQLPEDRSEEGFERLSYVRNTIHQILKSAFPDYVPKCYYGSFSLFKDDSGRFGYRRIGWNIEDCFKDEHFQPFGQIINVVEDITEQKLKERKRDDSVSPQHWERGKIALLRARFDEILTNRRGTDRDLERTKICVIVELVTTGHHLMKLTREISTPDGCVSNISKTGPGLFRSILGKPNTPVFYGREHIPEDQQLLDNCFDKGFERLSYVRNTIQEIFKSALPDSLTEKCRTWCDWSEQQFESDTFLENRWNIEEYYRDGHFQLLGQIINVVEDIIEQKLEKRKTDGSVSLQHWEPGKIDHLKAIFDLINRCDVNKRLFEHVRIFDSVADVIIGYHLMKLTREISTPDGCVCNISKTDHCVSGLPSPTGGDHS